MDAINHPKMLEVPGVGAIFIKALNQLLEEEGYHSIPPISPQVVLLSHPVQHISGLTMT
jgi:hypothetical protein